MKLSILIPCLPETESQNYLGRLMHILKPQIERYPNVELLTNNADRTTPTGTKRNELISRAKGEYFTQIDCDDTVPIYYVSELLKAIKYSPDVVTFQGHMITDGTNKKNFTIKLGEAYEERNGHYYRYPNHLCCFKKSIVEHIKFLPIWFKEDYHWATSIRDKGLLKSEIHIDSDMYCYDYKTKKPRNSIYSRARR
jgi:glycosyltransferase involved in cell wall biosynthesis